jgi:hypothetical protein
MKFAVAHEHRDFFRKHHRIEFEALLSSKQQQLLVENIPTVLSSRLGIAPEKWDSIAPEKLFMVARDLWRANVSLKKVILQKFFAEIASELIEYKPLRIGYDQLYLSKPRFQASSEKSFYTEFLNKRHSLNEGSSLQGIACGLMLCLSHLFSESEEHQKTNELLLESPRLFSPKSGSGVFFSPDIPIPFEELTAHPGAIYLLIVYTKAYTIYSLQPNDPHTHDFKHLGYGIGDKLSDKLNPVIYR